MSEDISHQRHKRHAHQGLEALRHRKETTMAPTTATVPADNLAMRTHVIEECVPQLSLADLEAVAEVMNRRYQELKAAQQRKVLEAHYAHLRALPAGTPLQVDRY